MYGFWLHLTRVLAHVAHLHQSSEVLDHSGTQYGGIPLFGFTSPYTPKEKYEDLQKLFLVWVFSTDTYCIRN